MADEPEKVNAEDAENGGRIGDSGNSGDGTSGDAGAVNRADAGAIGDGNGASIGGSPGSDGDGGGSPGNSGASPGPGGERDGDGVGRESGSGAATVGDPGPGIGGDSGGVKRGRGRPRKLDGRNSSTGSAGSRAATGSQNKQDPELVDLGSQKDPKSVPDSVFEPEDLSKLSKSEIATAIAALLQGVFLMVAQGLKQEHWKLRDGEALELAKATWECLKTLPSKQNKKLEKWLKEWSPWIKLAMVAAAVMGPRASLSLEIAAKEKDARANAINAGAANNGNGAGADAGEWFPGTADFIQ